MSQAIGMAMSGQTSLVSLPELRADEQPGGSYRTGFVGVGLTREVGELFIDGIAVEDTAEEEEPADLGELMRRIKEKFSGGQRDE